MIILTQQQFQFLNIKKMDIFNKTQIFNDLEELSQLAIKIDKQNEQLINYINK